MTTAAPGFGTIRSAPSTPFVPAFRVLAACILVRDFDGQIHHAYAGCLLETLMPDQEELFLAQGLVERVAKK